MTESAAPAAPEPEGVFTYGAPQPEVRAGRVGRDRLRPLAARRRGGSSSSPTRGSPPPGTRSGSPTQMARVRHRGAGLGRRPRRADRRQPAGGGRRRPRQRALGRVRRRRRRVEHRHRQGDQPAHHQPRRAHGLHQRAGRAGARRRPSRSSRWSRCRRPPAPARRARRSACSTCCPQGQDRHQPRPAAPDAGRRRPRLTLTQPADGHRRGRHGHPVPRARELHRALVHDAPTRKKPEQRVPYCGANPVADMWSEKAMSLLASVLPPGRARRRRTRARAGHGAGRDVRRDGLRQRRRAHPARQRLPDRRPGARLPPVGLPGRRADRAARHVGVAHRARGLPVHLRGRAPSATCGRRAARSDRARTADPSEQLPAALIALMRDIGIPNGIGGVGYGEQDVDDLVEGTMKQQRMLAVAPRQVTEDDVARIFSGSLEPGEPPRG